MDKFDPYEFDVHAAVPFPPVFMALRERAKARGVWVGVRQWCRAWGETRAEFVSKAVTSGGCPRILVRTRRAAVHDVVDSMILAHEMGHHLSYDRGELSRTLRSFLERTPEQLHKNGPGLARMIAEEVIAEEMRAWNYARDDLRGCGFTSWSLFDRWANASVGSYVRGLDLHSPPARGRID